jgi:hypothetical protein
LLPEAFPSLLDALHIQGVQASLICLAASSELDGPIFMQVAAGVSGSGPAMIHISGCHGLSLPLLLALLVFNASSCFGRHAATEWPPGLHSVIFVLHGCLLVAIWS